MCTLSYQTERHSDDEYRWVLFNRDELRTRPKALPPRSFSGAHGNYLMPVDPQGGGSWMGLHDAGFFVCLLNYYPNDEIILGPSFRSRGLLIRDILEAGVFPDGGYLDSRMKDAQYAPFYLAAFTGGETRMGSWDRNSLESLDTSPCILSSSGYQHTRISAVRRDLFARRRDAGKAESLDDLREFHRLEDPENGSDGILMTRSDAMTVSISEIGLGGQIGIIRYYERDDPDRPRESTIRFAGA